MRDERKGREEITERLHEACRGVRTLCRELEEAAADPPAGASSADVAAKLDALADRLSDYFALEEEVEPFREVLEPGARLDERAAALAAEHGPLVSRARQIAARAKGSGEAGVAEEISAFLADLRRHESEENEIVQRFYCEDIGRGD